MSKKLNTEDLIKLAEQPKTAEEQQTDFSDFKNDVLTFIYKLNIEPGDYSVNINTLYLIYKAWSHDPVNKIQFNDTVTKVLPTEEKSGINKAIFLNKNTLKLTHEAYTKFKKTRNPILNSVSNDKFQNFLKFNHIQRGDFYAPIECLYELYKKYLPNTDIKKPFSLQTFQNFCKINFKYKNLSTGLVFAVSENVKNLIQQLEQNNNAQKKKNKSKK